MKHIAWLWLFAVVGCTDFESVDRGVCGNGLLEVGEDCDSSDPACVSCAVVCATAEDCPSTEYTCGIDGLCHAPSGTFASPQLAGAFESNDYRLTDIDHDGIRDAVGVSRSSIVVRFGDVGDPLSSLESVLTPVQTGPATFGDIDLDGSLDLGIVTPDGLASYSSPYGRLSSREVQTTIVDSQSGMDADVRAVFQINSMLFVLGGANGVLGYFVSDYLAGSQIGDMPCGITLPADGLAAETVELYLVSKPNDIATDALVSFVVASGAQQRLCVLSIHKDNILAAPVIRDVTPALATTVSSRPVLADLTSDGERCPTLVITDNGVAQLRKFDGVRDGTTNHCKFQVARSSLPPINSVSTTSAVIGSAPLDPIPIAFAPDALVLEAGVFGLASGTTWYSLYGASRPITGVRFADLDHDSDVDIVLTAASDDIDVLLRPTGGLGGAFAAFQLFRIDTAGRAELPVVEDFDGNTYADVAYVEPIGENQRLMISYGTPDRLLPPVEVARFAKLSTMSSVRAPDSADPTAEIADLIVLLPGTPSRVAFLFGSTQRTMVSYFDPRYDASDRPEARDATQFRAAAIGRFSPDNDTLPDIVALASLQAGRSLQSGAILPPVLNATAAVRAWNVRGTTDGLDGTQSDGVALDGVDDCAVPGGSGLCVEDSMTISWSVSGGREVVIAVDKGNRMVVFDPALTVNSMLTATPVTLAVPAMTVVRSLHASDLDGDGAPELVAAFAPKDGGRGAVLVCAVSPAGIPGGCEDLVPTIIAAAPTTTGCLDAAPARFAFRDPTTPSSPGTELVVMCRDTGSVLIRVYRDGTSFAVQPLVRLPGALFAIEAGDVTGDGLDDVVGLVGDPGARNILVVPQCASRDARTCDSLSKESP